MAEETNTTVTETNTAENSGGDPQSGTDNNVNAVSTNEGAEKTFNYMNSNFIIIFLHKIRCCFQFWKSKPN